MNESTWPEPATRWQQQRLTGFLIRVVRVGGSSDGPGGEIHHDPPVQERLLPRNHRRREEGPGNPGPDQVSSSSLTASPSSLPVCNSCLSQETPSAFCYPAAFKAQLHVSTWEQLHTACQRPPGGAPCWASLSPRGRCTEPLAWRS